MFNSSNQANKKTNLRESGFTLIELLVVISIIGILATLLVANYNATRQRARDAQRKSDLRNIQTALRTYYNDYGRYPGSSGGSILGCGTNGTSVCNWGGTFSAGSSNVVYMNLLPNDPQGSIRRYNYVRISNEDYTLSACLENKADDKCKTGATCSWLSGVDGCVYEVKP